KLTPSGCKEPAGGMTSLAVARAYYTHLVACLNKAWAPVVRQAGFTFRPPRLVVLLGQSPDSACDMPDGELYYCDGTIYMDAKPDLDYEKENRAANRALMVFFIAHEYAHHIQALTGISKAHDERNLKLNGVDVQLQETRRIELQADCLSGAFLASIRPTFPIGAQWVRVWSETYAHYTDPNSDHGQGATRRAWSRKGFTKADVSACNTFVASPAQVS
ncbi:neutral zinc metallopeptidase, partial [Kribbella albertanoniae]